MAAWPTLRSCRGRPGRCWRSGPATTRPSTSPSPSSRRARRRRGVTPPAGPLPTGTPGTRPPHAPRRRPGPPPPGQYPGPVRQLQPSRTGPPDGQTIGYPRQDLRLLPQPHQRRGLHHHPQLPPHRQQTQHEPARRPPAAPYLSPWYRSRVLTTYPVAAARGGRDQRN